MRAVLDVNVVISALLAPSGSPASILRLWLDGAFELIVSELLLAELERALAYPKLRTRIQEVDAAELVHLLREQAHMVDNPDGPPEIRSADPGDDYLIALAAAAHAAVVSGDRHLLDLAGRLPVYSPTEFLGLLLHSGS